MRHLFAILLAIAIPAAGCSLPRIAGRDSVAVGLAERTALEMPGDIERAACVEELVAGRVLSEDEAVSLALWNNPAFLDLLVDLDLSRADVITAGQLTNPELWSVFPVGPKQFEMALNVPLEAIWLRPRRVSAAELTNRRVGQRLVQDGLNLVRDVRLAYADLVLSHDRRRLAEEGAQLRDRLRTLAEARLAAGDASELEVTAVRIDALIGRQDARRLTHDVTLAEARLAMLMGASCATLEFEVSGRDLPPAMPAIDQLICEARETRPDLWALGLAIEAAAERVELARHDYLRVIGVLPDINSKGRKGFEAGPGIQFTVPIFHQNQGAIARAQAELDRAQWQYEALLATVVLDVRQAAARLSQAREDLAAWDDELLPATTEASRQAEKAYQGGGTPVLLVLESSRQALLAQTRRIESAAAARRAAAELERAVGRRLFFPDEPEPLSAPAPDVSKQ